MIAYQSQTCGTCVHWQQTEIQGGVIDLSAPRQGVCRAFPPSVSLLPSKQGVGMTANYPVLPASFPACGQHHPRIPLAVVDSNP